jgi:hypothetical protein
VTCLFFVVVVFVVFNAVSSLSMVTGNGNAREQQRLTILYHSPGRLGSSLAGL